MSNTSKRTTRRARNMLFVLVLSLATPGLGGAHATTENAYFDDFEKKGPLPGRAANDPWETKTGSWSVVEQSFPDAPLVGETNHVLVQTSRAIIPNEPMTFVRGRMFREFTAQVTAGFLDPTSTGDPAPNSSLGIVFRAPITDDIADKDNTYLFSAEITGVQANTFPTGKALILFKRVGRTYFMVRQQVVPSWADLTRAHEYKVVAGGGRILCYFDGRLVIDYTDKALGDEPVLEDEMPGVPYESGAVGLRTSSARAWFDNFRVIGNDAYEGRAAAIDANVQYGDSSPNVRRGTSVQLGADLRRQGVTAGDTGFQYHDHAPFDDAVVRSIDSPNGGSPSIGAALRTRAVGDSVQSIARLNGLDLTFSDPDDKIRVFIKAATVEASGLASCTSTSSNVAITDGSISVEIENLDPRSGHTVIGPFPLRSSYSPNTLLVGGSAPFPFSIWAHKLTATREPRRVDLVGIQIVFGSNKPIGGTLAPGVRIPETSVPTVPVEVNIGNVVAGRFCR